MLLNFHFDWSRSFEFSLHHHSSSDGAFAPNLRHFSTIMFWACSPRSTGHLASGVRNRRGDHQRVFSSLPITYGCPVAIRFLHKLILFLSFSVRSELPFGTFSHQMHNFIFLFFHSYCYTLNSHLFWSGFHAMWARHKFRFKTDGHMFLC